MKGFIADIEDLTTSNTDFRRVLYTGKFLQLVLMTLQPGEEIGEEVHEDHDQFFRIESGSGEVLIDGVRTPIKDDDAVIVPAGARHNVTNTGDQPLTLYTCTARRIIARAWCTGPRPTPTPPKSISTARPPSSGRLRAGHCPLAISRA